MREIVGICGNARSIVETTEEALGQVEDEEVIGNYWL